MKGINWVTLLCVGRNYLDRKGNYSPTAQLYDLIFRGEPITDEYIGECSVNFNAELFLLKVIRVQKEVGRTQEHIKSVQILKDNRGVVKEEMELSGLISVLTGLSTCISS